MTPTTRTTPDAWARANRTYPPTAGLPGPRDPRLTPYTIPFVRAVHARTHKRVVMVVGAQMGKSDSILDIIGERMDTAPVPMLYLGPTRLFLQEQWEPRIMQLLDEAPSLRFKVARGKRMTKTRKIIAGVPLRLAHGGSSVAIKSDPFGLAFTDEADELLANVKGSGDPISQVDRRGDTYADFVHAIVSTPTEGPSDVDVDEASGLQFWADIDPQEIGSTIWRLWQGGTRYHWAWPCPHCGEFFIPRFRCLAWDKPTDATGKELRSDPVMASQTAHLVCPKNGCVITDDARARMNARGVYVAPGQHVRPDGKVVGEAPESWTVSFWVSGLASPFKTWGERAAEYVAAVRSGEPGEIQSVVNGGFGELWAPGGGDVPEWRELEKLKLPYLSGEVPADVRVLTAGADVQKDRIEVDVWAWGRGLESWLVDHIVIEGGPDRHEAWGDLTELLGRTWPHESGAHLKIARLAIDTGYEAPAVYGWSRAQGFAQVVPVKGVEGFNRASPVSGPTYVDATEGGKRLRRGARLWTVAVSTFKAETYRFLRLERPTDEERADGAAFSPGTVHLPHWVENEWLKQFVAEQLVTVRTKRGFARLEWQKLRERNEALDCRVYARAAAWIAGADRWSDEKWRDLEAQLGVADASADPAGQINRQAQTPQGKRRSDWLGRRGGWF